MIGDVRRSGGDRTGALAAYEESLAIRRKLAASDPGNAGWQRDVGVNLNRVEDERLEQGDRVGALAAAEESLTFMRKLAASDPGNVGWQANLVISLYKVSNASEPARARAALNEAIVIADALARDNKLTAARRNWPQMLRDALAKLPEQVQAEWQRDTGVDLAKVGDVRLAAGDHAGALSAYEKSLAIMRKLAASDLGNAGWQRDTGVALLKVGDARLAAGDRAGALSAYEESLAIMRKFAGASGPGNTGWQTDLAVSLYKVSIASEPAGARAALREALAIVEALARANGLTAAQKNWPQMLRNALAKLPPETAGAQ
jgi:hypothetical protein